MKLRLARKVFLYKFGFGLAVAALLFGIAIEVHTDPLKDLHGPSFTDPSEILEMPDSWEQQHVRYDLSEKDADLVVSLDQQMYPALEPVIQGYARDRSMKIVVKNATCGISSGTLSRKSVDIGGYCCAPGLTDRLPGLRFHTLGIAALTLIVHTDNPIDNITVEQARRIFMGEIYRWSELETSEGRKGENLPIQPVGRLHCKLRPGHWRLLLDNEDLFSASLLEVGAIPDMITQISSNKRSIGFETLWMKRHFHEHGRVKVLKINGYDPKDSSHAVSGDYPLYRVYTLTTWEGEGIVNPLALKLVEYLLQQVEHLEGKFNLVPVSRLRQAGWKFHGNELIGEPE
jgi:hypothetical protein